MKKGTLFAGIASAFVASALTLGLTATSAVAEDAVQEPSAAPTITKTVEANSSIDITGTTFTYKFVQDDYAAGGTSATADAVAITDVTITPDANITGTDTSKDFTANITLPKNTAFPHAGIYKYILTETQPDPNLTADGVTYSKAVYEMYVYVDNTTNDSGADKNLSVNAKVTFVQTKDDRGDDVTDAEKVAPTFTNNFSPLSDLKIAKEVTGAYGDKEKDFTFEVVVTFPANATAADSYTGTYTARSGHTHAALTLTPATAHGVTTLTASGVTLADGENLVIAGLPVGATYTVKETGVTGYTPSGSVVYSGKNAAGTTTDTTTDVAAGTKGAEYTVDLTSATDVTKSTTVGAGANNATTITNNYVPTTPTGILMNALPYMVLIGIPVAALIGYVMIRSKRYAQGA